MSIERRPLEAGYMVQLISRGADSDFTGALWTRFLRMECRRQDRESGGLAVAILFISRGMLDVRARTFHQSLLG